jgi:hypothetical protein
VLCAQLFFDQVHNACSVALLDHLNVTNATLVMHDWSGAPH